MRTLRLNQVNTEQARAYAHELGDLLAEAGLEVRKTRNTQANVGKTALFVLAQLLIAEREQ